MAIFDIFSKRQKRLTVENPDVLIYDQLPESLRVQIVHIIRDAIGTDRSIYSNSAASTYDTVNDILCKEYGLFQLHKRNATSKDAIFNFFLETTDINRALDVVELEFVIIESIKDDFTYKNSTNRSIDPDDAIEELNIRFKEHGVGYQFESNKIIKIDSTFTHSAIIKPALSLLQNKIYSGANEEFLSAYEHYRHGRNKECLNDCLKSFESVMKVICNKRKWKYSVKDTSKTLIDICFSKNLIPSFLQSQFNSLRSLIESGIPTIRNRTSGHGQGINKIEVEDYIAGYALNLTASNILLLINSEKEL